MKKNLNDRFLKTVKPPESGRDTYIDTEGPGIELRVTANGVKSWSIRYRLKGGARNRTTYGSYPAISLRSARDRAIDIRAAAIRGIDLPAQEAGDADLQRKAAEQPQTVAALISEYVDQHCKQTQRRWKLTDRLFALHVTPAIGDKALSELRRADIVELLDGLQNEKGFRAQVNRVRSQLVAALNWAIEREYIDTNPAAAIRRRKIEASRSRVLSNDEIRAIWAAAETLTDPSRALVKAWILTGQRRDEVRCMTWDEIKGDVWTIPAARNKGKRDHDVPLSPMMAALLEGLIKAKSFVFTIDGEKPYAGQARLKAIIDRDCKVTGWTFHDIRRTVSTGMASLNVAQDTIDRVLNHAKQTLAGTYNRHQYLAEKRAALTAWANHVSFVVGTARDAENVRTLRQG